MRQLRFGVRDGTLKLGLSHVIQDVLVHIADMDLLFLTLYLLTLNQ